MSSHGLSISLLLISRVKQVKILNVYVIINTISQIRTHTRNTQCTHIYMNETRIISHIHERAHARNTGIINTNIILLLKLLLSLCHYYHHHYLYYIIIIKKGDLIKVLTIFYARCRDVSHIIIVINYY